MGRKQDLLQVRKVALDSNIDRHKFGDFLEKSKERGKGGTKNERGDFTWGELLEKAEEFKALLTKRTQDRVKKRAKALLTKKA